MNNVIKTQKLVLNTLKLLNEEVEENKYYTISPAEYLEVMKFAGYNGNVFSKLKKYEGKQLVIDGNVNLASTPTKVLGNIHTINGSLDISYTQVASIGTINVTGPIRDYNSPREKIRIAQELKRRIAVLDSDREEKTRDINNPDIDEEGIRANVLFEYLKNNGDVKEPDEDELQEIKEIEAKLVELNKRYDESKDPEVYNKLSSEISDLEERLEEIKPEIDVYHIEKERYGHYGGLMVFQVLHPDFQNREYTVGTEDEMEEGTIEYAEQMIDDTGIDGFNSSFVENYIDEDAVRELFEDYYENDVRDNPEVYFSKDDYQLTDEQEKRIEELQNYIEELENYISDKEKEQNNLESEIEDPKEYEKFFDEIQKLIDDAEDKKDTAQDELDGIEPDDEPTEEMIEQKVSDMVYDRMRDPVDSLKDWGYEIKDYIDKEALAKGLADSDGWGVMNGYDGNYDSVDFNGNTYYVMRIS